MFFPPVLCKSHPSWLHAQCVLRSVFRLSSWQRWCDHFSVLPFSGDSHRLTVIHIRSLAQCVCMETLWCQIFFRILLKLKDFPPPYFRVMITRFEGWNSAKGACIERISGSIVHFSVFHLHALGIPKYTSDKMQLNTLLLFILTVGCTFYFLSVCHFSNIMNSFGAHYPDIFYQSHKDFEDVTLLPVPVSQWNQPSLTSQSQIHSRRL